MIYTLIVWNMQPQLLSLDISDKLETVHSVEIMFMVFMLSFTSSHNENNVTESINILMRLILSTHSFNKTAFPLWCESQKLTE